MEPPPSRAAILDASFQHGLDAMGACAELGLEKADQVLVGLADRPRIAVEVEQADRIDVAERLPQRDVPVDLIGERVPGEADHRHAGLADELHVVPLPPQPARPLAGVHAVGLGVHHRPPVALVVLAGDGIPAEQLPERLRMAVAVDELLVPLVVVDARGSRVCARPAA